MLQAGVTEQFELLTSNYFLKGSGDLITLEIRVNERSDLVAGLFQLQ